MILENSVRLLVEEMGKPSDFQGKKIDKAGGRGRAISKKNWKLLERTTGSAEPETNARGEKKEKSCETKNQATKRVSENRENIS